MTHSDRSSAVEDRQTKKLATLQAGRGLAATAVLAFHVNVIYGYEIASDARPFKFLNLGGAGVEYFFVLSGFIIALVHAKDIGKPARLTDYAFRRFIRIYPIFWVILTVFILAQLILGRLDSSLTGWFSYVRAYALLPFDGGPPLVAAWTLSHELLFYTAFGLAILSRQVGMMLFLLWMAACLAATIWSKAGLGDLSYPLTFLFSDYNLMFGFGIIVARTYQTLSQQLAKGLIGLGLVLFGVAGYFTVMQGVGGIDLLYGAAAALVIAGFASLENSGRISVGRALNELGDASYSIYLIHGPAAVVIAMILAKSGLASLLGTAVTLIIMGVGALVSGLTCYYLCEAPLLKWLSRSRRKNYQQPLETNA